MKRSIHSIALLLLAVCTAVAQTQHLVPSGSAHITLSVWEAEHPRDTVIVLLPGFGSGPPDVFGIAEHLSEGGYTTIYLTPRGWHGSSGFYSYANSLADIETAIRWTRASMEGELALGGYSWGGGLALYLATQDSTIGRVFTVAAADQAALHRKYERDSVYARGIDEWLQWSSGSGGWLRFEDGYDLIQDLAQHQDVLDVVKNAPRLSDRSVLLIGGWHDETLEDTIIPLYRALKSAGSSNVELVVFEDDHSYKNSDDDVRAAIMSWLDR